jgi:hypothetical protein
METSIYTQRTTNRQLRHHPARAGPVAPIGDGVADPKGPPVLFHVGTFSQINGIGRMSYPIAR